MFKRCVLWFKAFVGFGVQTMLYLNWYLNLAASEASQSTHHITTSKACTPVSCPGGQDPRSLAYYRVNPSALGVEAPTHRMIAVLNGYIGGHGCHGWPGVSWGHLWVSEMCVSHWRTILWSSRDADTPPKNGFVPENSAQGGKSYGKKNKVTKCMSSCKEQDDGLPSYLWNQSEPRSVKLPLREKWLIRTSSFTYPLRFSVEFLWVKLPWKYSHFSMNSTLFIYFCHG